MEGESGDRGLTDKPMPLLDHLVELRRRLLYAGLGFLVAFVVGYTFAADIFAFLVHPLASIFEGQAGRRMIFTGLTEAFFTYVKIGLFGALFISFPLLASQIWVFVAPGLYRTERRAFLPFLFATPVFFLMGAGMVYYFVFPVAWSFFLGFEIQPTAPDQLPIQLEAKIDQYLSLVMSLILAFGCAFEMPVLLTLLVRVGLVSAAQLAAKRRHAIVIVFIIAAVITPPDVISQVSLAVPMLILYELSILAARLIERGRAKREAEDAAA
ncbi:MAG: twin-arginine translocase subunit TatC [Alphaproteobacteria bacterium]|nr:twin-arginine translocase subunit TatC [Alphaproteobacteria bacterium]